MYENRGRKCDSSSIAKRGAAVKLAVVLLRKHIKMTKLKQNKTKLTNVKIICKDTTRGSLFFFETFFFFLAKSAKKTMEAILTTEEDLLFFSR